MHSCYELKNDTYIYIYIYICTYVSSKYINRDMQVSWQSRSSTKAGHGTVPLAQALVHTGVELHASAKVCFSNRL